MKMKKIIAIGIIGLFLLSSLMITSVLGENNNPVNENFEININILDDGDSSTGSSTDNLVHVPAFDPSNNTVGTIDTYFNISYSNISFGSSTDLYYINITGDTLFPTSNNTLVHLGDDVWRLTWIPTKADGSLTITVSLQYSGSDSETIDIINGSVVTTNIDSFFYGDIANITVTVKDRFGYPQLNADVYLIWFSGPTRVDQIIPGDGSPGRGQNGEYDFHILPSDQPDSAPDNLVIAAKSTGYNPEHWGYANIRLLEKNSPILDALIKRGFSFGKIRTTLKNIGEFDASNIQMNLHVEYGLLKRTKDDDKIISLSPDEDTTFEIVKLRGVGLIKVKLTVSSDEIESIEEERIGLIFGRFIFLF
jgi:hypothetical protein